MRRLGPALSLALLLALLGSPAAADVWQWTDAEGVVRYTPDPERVPAGRRDTMVKVEPGMPAPRPRGAPTPGAVYAPSQELPRGVDPFNAPDQARSLEAVDVPEPGPGDPPAGAAAPAPSFAERSRRAEIAARIAADEEALKQLISNPDAPPPDSAELREIARRLPALQAELRALDEAQARRERRPAPRP
jgi:hypothetical protein